MPDIQFSVVIPTRNGEPYIAAAIESALGQTYPYFEIILLEHESDDRTVEIARTYDDTRIRICSSDQHQTIESNWARMLDLELSEYLTILGHDDILYPGFLQEIVNLIRREPDASLYLTHFHIIDSDGAVIRPCKPSPYKESGEAFMQARQRFQRDSFATGYVMRSVDYKRIGGFRPFPRLIYADDFAFYSLAGLAGKVCSPRYLFGYRYHRKSEAYVSGLETLTEAAQCLISALEKTSYARDPANMAQVHDYVYKTFIRRYIRILINLMQSGDAEKRDHFRAIREDFLRRFPRQTSSRYDLLATLLESLLRLLPAWSRGLISSVLQYGVRRTRGIKN